MRIALLAFSVLVLAGVAQAQTLPPACGLMTQATAAAINGAPVSAGKEQDYSADSHTCTFDGNGNNGTVSVEEDAASATGASVSAMFKMTGETLPPGMTLTKMSGIGDGAYYTQNGQDYDVYVLKGEVMLDVSSVQPQGAISGLQAAMVAAAKLALKGM